MSMRFLVILSLAMLILPLSSLAEKDQPAIEKGQLLQSQRPLVRSMEDRLGGSVWDLVYEEDFESGAGGWSLSGVWQIGDPSSGPNSGHQSSNCAGTNLSGNYPNNAADRLVSPSVNLPSLSGPASRLTLAFYEWFELESGYDYGRVEVSTNGGSTWQNLGVRHGSSGWGQTTIDLGPFAGQTVKISFRLTSDGSVTYEGWFIDNIEIYLEEPEPLSAAMVSLNHQKFPFIYSHVNVTSFGSVLLDLDQSNFAAYENGVLQTDFFGVTAPDVGGGVRRADIVFLMDNSGSMEEEYNAVRNNVLDFVDGLVAGGVDFGLGLCRFGESASGGTPIVEDSGALTQDADYFKTDVWGRNVVSGGFEPGWDALYVSASSFSFRPGAHKVFILITDESPTGDDNVGTYTQAQALSLLQSNSITVFALINTSDGYSIQDYGTIAEQTNGDYYDIFSPFDDILTSITSHVTSTYLVRYKSDNPSFDGTQRHVEIVVTNEGEQATCEGWYVPGSSPQIQRTQSTLDLHRRAWAEGTEFTIEVEIVDNVPPGVQTATLYFRKTGTTSYSSTTMVRTQGGEYFGTIPSYAVETPGIDYYVDATDGQTTASDPSSDPVSNPYQLAILPNVAPVINHSPPATYVADQPTPISAEVIDGTNMVEDVWLYFREYGQLVYGSSEMSFTFGDTYEASIPREYAGVNGIEYYIRAQDDLGIATYFGTADVPVQILDPSSYVDEKMAIINFFNLENFYSQAEGDALNFVEDVDRRIDAGTASGDDIEGLRRLHYVEDAALTAYRFPTDANVRQIAAETGRASQSFAQSAIIGLIFGDFAAVLKPFKDIPFVGAVVRPVYSKALSISNNFITQALEGIARKAAVAASDKAFHHAYYVEQRPVLEATRIADAVLRANMEPWEFTLEEMSEQGAEWAVNNLDYIQNLLAGLYMGLYEDGIVVSIGGEDIPIMFRGTENILSMSVSDAESGNFADHTVGETARLVELAKNDIIHANRTAYDSIKSKNDLADFVGLAVLVGSLVVAVAAVIVGLVTAGPTAGVGAIVSIIGGLSIWGILKTISSFFTVGRLVVYGLAISGGAGHLGSEIPGKLSDVHQSCFESEAMIQIDAAVARRAPEIPLAKATTEWADSVYIAGLRVADDLSTLRASVVIRDWDQAADDLTFLDAEVADFIQKQDIATSVLGAIALYNPRESQGNVDSLFAYVTASSYASRASLDIARFAAAWGTVVEPSGAARDTLVELVDLSLASVSEVGPAFEETFDEVQALGLLVPNIVAIVEHSLEEDRTGYVARAQIQNISDQTVHDVSVSLRARRGSGAWIVAQSDTLIPALSPGEKRSLDWKVGYRGSEAILMLDLLVRPLNLPGDFTGDSRIISALITPDTSPPAGGPLATGNVYAYPNPFNPDFENVTLRFKLSRMGAVTIRIYDVSNRLVANVISGETMQPDEELSVTWDGKNNENEIVSNGVYFFVIESDAGEKGVGKLAVLR